MVEVRRVETKAEFEAFFRFPWKLYPEKYPCWVPELPSMRRETLDRKHHAAWEYLEGDYFVAWRGDEPVGTIAAFINHRHNQVHEENIGFFGFFECIEDERVAKALLSTAEIYLRGKGVTAVRGPANFSSNEQYGLLVNAFDQEPMILMPYNPPYYVSFIEQNGFEKVMDLFSWKLDKNLIHAVFYEEDGVTESQIVRVVRRNIERRGIEVRHINMKNKKAEFQTLRQLYESAWEKNWGFVPLTDRELDDLVKNLGLLLLPKYTFFVSVKGQIGGFMLLIPNLNEVFAHVKAHPGIPEIWWLLKTVWHWKIRNKITSMRTILMGVKEEYRGLGLESAMFLVGAEQVLQDQDYKWIEAGWVLESNENLNRMLRNFGGEVHRIHRLYQKPL